MFLYGTFFCVFFTMFFSLFRYAVLRYCFLRFTLLFPRFALLFLPFYAIVSSLCVIVSFALRYCFPSLRDCFSHFALLFPRFALLFPRFALLFPRFTLLFPRFALLFPRFTLWLCTLSDGCAYASLFADRGSIDHIDGLKCAQRYFFFFQYDQNSTLSSNKTIERSNCCSTLRRSTRRNARISLHRSAFRSPNAHFRRAKHFVLLSKLIAPLLNRKAVVRSKSDNRFPKEESKMKESALF